MRKSVIDIGTNTVLMLIAEYEPIGNIVKTILDIQRIPRLGKGVNKNRNILPESFEKAETILEEYMQISHEQGSKEIIATATSFLRDSANRKDFVTYIKERTGVNIEILSGDDEARWTFMGGTFDKLTNINEDLRITIIDIGGGSTEISSGKMPGKFTLEAINNIQISGHSFDVGSVRLKEKFFSIHPPSKNEISNSKDFILSHISNFDKFEEPAESDKSKLIGLAGTITTLGAIKLKLDKFIPEEIDNLELTITEVNQLLNIFSSRTSDELLTMGNYMEGRADIILSGTLILKCFMEKFGFDKLTISTKGLRYGILLRELCK